MIYAHYVGNGGVRYTMDFSGPLLQTADELGPFLLKKLGPIGKFVAQLDKSIKLGSGSCDINGHIKRIEAAKFDPEVQKLYESQGYQPGYNATYLTEEQLQTFLKNAYDRYPGLIDYYPSINDLINTARNRMPVLP